MYVPIRRRVHPGENRLLTLADTELRSVVPQLNCNSRDSVTCLSVVSRRCIVTCSCTVKPHCIWNEMCTVGKVGLWKRRVNQN